MGRPRIHPRRFYRATDSGVYFDQESDDEFTDGRGRIYPDIECEKNYPYITMSRQEKLCKKLVGFGVFELADDYPDGPEEIERVGGETKTVE